MSAEEILLKAADILERDGWIGGPAANWEEGPCCAAQAIWRAAGRPLHPDAVMSAYDVLASRLPLNRASSVAIGEWNDAQPDAATVIAALRSAARAEREKG